MKNKIIVFVVFICFISISNLTYAALEKQSQINEKRRQLQEAERQATIKTVTLLQEMVKLQKETNNLLKQLVNTKKSN